MNSGETLACFHVSGKIPLFILRFIIRVTSLVIIFVDSFNSVGPSWSRPVAFEISWLFKYFRVLSSVILQYENIYV